MKLSFIIPAYNSVTWLPHAVQSALGQTHKDIEVVIVNDGSTDQTIQYLEWQAKDKRVNIINNGVNKGRSYSRNLGNKEAQGDILAVLDADDLATPNRAELTIKKFKAGGLDFLYGAATMIDAVGRAGQVLFPDVFDTEKALKPPFHNGIVHSTVAYTRQFAEKYPYRDGDIAKLGIDDWAIQIEAKLAGAAFDFMTQRFACYRVLESQITKQRDEAKVLEAKKEFLKTLQVPA